MKNNTMLGNSKFNSSARIFGNAINILRNQSATSKVGADGRNQQERLPRKIENAVPSPRMPDDEYSLPLTVVDFTEDTNTSDSLLKPGSELQERHWLPITCILATMSDLRHETADDDYALPVFGSNIHASRLHTHESDLASNISYDYDLPLTTASYKGLSSSSSANSGGSAFDDGYEIQESLEKELPESSRDKDKGNTGCLDFEAEDNFPSLLSNKEASRRPRYNPRLSKKFIDKKLPESSGDKVQKNEGCLDCEAEEKLHRSLTAKDFTTRLPRYDPKRILSMKFRQGFIDCHCHIDILFNRVNFEGTFSEYRRQHKESFPDSYEGCVAVFCDPDTFNKKYIWQKILSEDNVWAAFGCHPKKSKYYSDRRERSLIAALNHHQVKALGEIGLDYSDRNTCDKETQHDVFRRQLRIAKWKNLPLVIHCREANEDTLDIMKEIVPRDHKIHLHCFTDVWEYAQVWLDTFPNLCIGITNVVTFSSAKETHQVVKNIPLNRLLLETDAPYFVPSPIASKNTRSSHPGMALHVAAQIAALRGESLENIVHQTRQNAYQIYGI